MESNLKKAYGYLRVSTAAQSKEDAFGLEDQRASIERYASENGYEIVEWREDVCSGAKETRPELDRMLYTADPPGTARVEAIIVAKSDRLSRDIMQYYYFKMLLLKKEIKLVSANAAEDFAAFGPIAPVLESMILSFAQFERQRINERMTGGRIAKISAGKSNCGGRPPFGYRVKTDPDSPKNKRLEIYEPEAEIVRRIYGARAEKTSLKHISRQIYRRYGLDLSLSKILYFLKNPLYFRVYGYAGVDVPGPELKIVKTEKRLDASPESGV